MIKAIIFDCFGVLVGRGFNETYSFAGGDPRKDHDFIEDILEQANRGQMTQAEFRKRICTQIGITHETYEDAVSRAERPNVELLQYIERLRPKYKTGVLSNVNSGVLERKIGTDWLKKSFDDWVISADVGFIKPEPEIYELAAKKLGAKPNECVFIDDRQVYVDAARAVGMQSFLYKDFEQMKNELEKILADSSAANN